MGGVVAVTGASAGVGRATVRRFAERGYDVGLLARGEAGLEAAAKEVDAAGQRAAPVVVDMADFEQADRAASSVEAQLGPIDIWVNDAFSTLFAPFSDVSAEEFRRATDVSYLGFVHGTMAALARMRARGHGAVVQVGSALAYRGIPLQAAYCGAKHAVQGFTESVRCELLHDHSPVRITMVQLPALNTPQFSWVLSRLPRHPRPVPPIYQPEVAARAIVYAAEHPDRHEFWVGGTTAATIIANAIVPGALDRYLARTGFSSQQTADAVDSDRPANLWDPVDADTDFGAHGIFDRQSHHRSAQWWLTQHRRLVWAGAVAVGAGLVARRCRR